MNKFVILFVLSLFVSYCQCICTGCVDLDELTFEKVIRKFRTSLVKLDQQFAYGDTHDAYTQLANEIGNKTFSDADHSDILIATVGIKDYGELENKALAERFGIFKRQDYPVIKLFIDGDMANAIDYKIGTEKVTTGKLYSFLKAHSKVHVQVPGCSKELDELAEKFLNNASQRKEILLEAEEFLEKIECEEKKKLQKMYTALMKGVIEKGEGFISMQRERMTKLLADKLSAKKIEEINNKLNILGSFRVKVTETKEEL